MAQYLYNRKTDKYILDGWNFKFQGLYLKKNTNFYQPTFAIKPSY